MSPTQPMGSADLDAVRALAPDVSNWGRWGTEDDRGTLNLVDPAAIRRGLASAITGEAISLSSPRGTWPQAGPRRLARQHGPIDAAGDTQGHQDVLTIDVERHPHWAAPSHLAYDGSLYNGVPASSVTVETGASRAGGDRIGPVVTRGILLDLARTQALHRLDPDAPIDRGHLDDALARAGTLPEAGDVLVIRTGAAPDAARWAEVSLDCAAWLHRLEIAAVALDVAPSIEFRLVAARDLGMPVGCWWVLDDLADHCAVDHHATFLLDATPVAVAGASVVPVAPVAVR